MKRCASQMSSFENLPVKSAKHGRYKNAVSVNLAEKCTLYHVITSIEAFEKLFKFHNAC